MSDQRMMHALARGARFQWISSDWHSDQKWHDCAVGTMDYPFSETSLRIHPDDAHLEYGPISGAMRDIVRFDGPLEYNPYWQMALKWLSEYATYCEPQASIHSFDEWGMFMLFAAEYLADMGL